MRLCRKSGSLLMLAGEPKRRQTANNDRATARHKVQHSWLPSGAAMLLSFAALLATVIYGLDVRKASSARTAAVGRSIRAARTIARRNTERAVRLGRLRQIIRDTKTLELQRWLSRFPG